MYAAIMFLVGLGFIVFFGAYNVTEKNKTPDPCIVVVLGRRWAKTKGKKSWAELHWVLLLLWFGYKRKRPNK